MTTVTTPFTPFVEVHPGDLITAFDWNAVLVEVNSLESRVAKLEAAGVTVTPGAPQITDHSPHGDFVNPGRLTLIGTGFAVPSTGNTIQFDGIDQQIAFIQGSDDKTLVFDIPALTPLPKDVSVSVRTSGGTSNAISVHMVAPVVAVTGLMSISKVVQNLPAVGKGTTFEFLITTSTEPPETPVTFSLSPSYSNANGSSVAAWSKPAVTIFVDESGQPLADSKVTILTGQPTTVGMKIDPPTGAKTVDLALHASADNSDDIRLTQTSGAISIEIGQPYKDNPNAPTFNLTGSGVNVHQTDVDGVEVWVVDHGADDAEIDFDAVLAVGGDYTFDASIEPADAVWGFVNSQQHVGPSSAPKATKGSTQALTIDLVNKATSATAKTWTVNVVATKTTTDTESGPFSSTFSFLIGIG